MPETVSLFGIKELDDFFQQMSRVDQRKIFHDAWREGTKPLISTSRSLLKSKMKTRSRTRNLEKSLGYVPIRSRGKSVFVSAKVGARKFKPYRGFHGHLYDAGTVKRQTKKGLSRGIMPASHFFTQALEQTQSEISNISNDQALKVLDKLIQRKLKKQAK